MACPDALAGTAIKTWGPKRRHIGMFMQLQIGDLHMTMRPSVSVCHAARAMFTAALLATTTLPAVAQTSGRSDTEAWQFEVTPYLFAADLNSTVGISTGLGTVTSEAPAAGPGRTGP